MPRLNERSLRDLASAGGGRYALLSADDRDLDTLLSGEAGQRSAEGESLATDQWREEGPWLVLLLLPLAALAFRRGWVVLIAVAILPAPRPAEASIWEDLWYTEDQQAQRQLQAGDANAAAALFEDPEWQAIAQYRAGDYKDSARTFAEGEDIRNLYNLGNALARQGEFESAIDAYDEVLEIDPDHEDARYNRDLLQQAESGGESEQEDSDQSAQSDSEQEGDASERDQEQADQEDLEALQEELQRAAEEAQQNQEQMAQQQLTPEELEAMRREQEQQQAMEQWLRRIPNDPGGLLRRKFRYQYQKSGKDQDGNNTWPDDEVQPW